MGTEPQVGAVRPEGRWQKVVQGQGVDKGDVHMVSAAEVLSVSSRVPASCALPSLATAGASTQGGSDTDGEDEDDKKSRGSMAQSVSSIASSKPNSKRNAKHQEKKRMKTMLNLLEKKKAAGVPVEEWMPAEEWRERRRGGDAELFNFLVAEMSAMQISAEEKHQHIAIMFGHVNVCQEDEERAAEQVAEEQVAAECPEDDPSKCDYCVLCDKTVTQEHLRSDLHRHRTAQHLALNALVGSRADGSIRPLFIGYDGLLNKERFEAWWGRRVRDLADNGMRKIRQHGFTVKSSINGKCWPADVDQVRRLKLGVASYTAWSSKYEGQVYMPYDRVPDHESGDNPRAPQSSTWWPVCEIEWQDPPSTVADATALICIYQFTEDVPSAWVWWGKPVEAGPPPPRPPPPLPLDQGAGVWDPPPEPAPRVPVLRLRGTAAPPPPPPPPPPTWGDTRRPGAIAAEAEEVD